MHNVQLMYRIFSNRVVCASIMLDRSKKQNNYNGIDHTNNNFHESVIGAEHKPLSQFRNQRDASKFNFLSVFSLLHQNSIGSVLLSFDISRSKNTARLLFKNGFIWQIALPLTGRKQNQQT